MTAVHRSAAAVTAAFVLAGCSSLGATPARSAVEGGDAARGEQAIAEYGCGTCHAIPGVPGADGRVGPRLHDFENQVYIAGQLPNRPEELIRWIQDPQSIEPGTAMPDMDVTEQDARDIAAYLYGD